MDERTNALARALCERMDGEAELFARLGVELERLRGSLESRSWSAGLVIAQGIEDAAGRLERVDAERDELFSALRGAVDLPRETAFSAVLPFLPGGCRGDLEESWRRLRIAVVRLKTASGRMRYASEALAGVLGRILEQAFPYRKGRIYSRRGTPTSVVGAMIVDRSQ